MWEGIKQDQYLKSVLKLSEWFQYEHYPTHFNVWPLRQNLGVGMGVGWEMGFLDWYRSTTYASNGLENDCPLFAPISNFPCKDCKIRIYNAFMLLNFSYCSIVCHFCSRQPVYKRERNTTQGITSSFKWLSDIISRFTECSLSPNSAYGSRMKTIPTEMFKCMNNINPTS